MSTSILIADPECRTIATAPSSLGSIDWYLVVVDKTQFMKDKTGSIGNWFEANGAEVAESIYSEEIPEPIFILHCTTSNGESVTPITQSNVSKESFVINRTNCDSVLSHHCLATKRVGSNLHFRSGFHEWLVTDTPDRTAPNSWDSMKYQVSNFAYSEFIIPSVKFWKAYETQVSKWQFFGAKT